MGKSRVPGNEWTPVNMALDLTLKRGDADASLLHLIVLVNSWMSGLDRDHLGTMSMNGIYGFKSGRLRRVNSYLLLGLLGLKRGGQAESFSLGSVKLSLYSRGDQCCRGSEANY